MKHVGSPRSRETPVELLVVLGSPNDDDGRLSPRAVERLRGALREHRARPDLPILLTGGFGEHFNRSSPRPHAEHALARFRASVA